MKPIRKLHKFDLVAIVESVQALLYVDVDSRGRAIWNPDRECRGADLCDHVVGLLARYNLVPSEQVVVPPEGETEAS